jgi:hypothetical protein
VTSHWALIRWGMFGVQVIGDGGRASLEEVAALIEEGERLAVSVPKEMSVSCGPRFRVRGMAHSR